jgi:hypothetical protein
MTARHARAIGSAVLAGALAACTSFYEVAIETPIQPKLDVAAFTRVLVAGFIAGGSEDVDVNLETVRLLRSQLRNRSQLRVIEADVLPLAQIVLDQHRERGPDGAGSGDERQELKPPERIRSEKDLEAYEAIFANVEFWKKLGEEYQNPLIVTGTILFTPHSRSGFVMRDQEVFDAFGRRRVVPIRTYRERKGYILSPKFIFIDGRTGTTLYSESLREEVLYDVQQNTPALSSYFELMDRVLPTFLNTLSTQKVRGTRVLLK